MTITIPSGRTLPLQAKAGGGFQSSGVGAGSGASPFFEDDFSSGDLSKTQTRDDNGWIWNSNAPVSVDSAIAYTGNNSVKLTFGPDASGQDSRAELIFKLGKAVSEIWLEWYLYIPSNYFHRDDTDTDNNKLFQLNFDNAFYQALTGQTLPQYGDSKPGTSKMDRFASATVDPTTGEDNWPVTGQPEVLDLIGSEPSFTGAAYAMNPGQWNQLRVYFKSSTDGTEADGLARFWANGSLERELVWPFWKPETSGQINGGYLLGAANSGFADETNFRIDAVKVYDTDPGWV